MKILNLISPENDFKKENTAIFDKKLRVVSLIAQYHHDYTVKDRVKLMSMEMNALQSIAKVVREEKSIGDKKPIETSNAINLSSDFKKEKQEQVVENETEKKRNVSDLVNYSTPAKKNQPDLKLLYLKKKDGFLKQRISFKRLMLPQEGKRILMGLRSLASILSILLDIQMPLAERFQAIP